MSGRCPSPAWRRHAFILLVIGLLSAVPATAHAEVFKVATSGFRCFDAAVDSAPLSIVTPCSHTDTFSDPESGFFDQIVYEGLFKARADHTSLGAYVEAFNTELGPDHVLRTPLHAGASAELMGTLVVSGGTGSGVVTTVFSVDGSSFVTHPDFALDAIPVLSFNAGGSSYLLEGPGTLAVSIPFVFDVPFAFHWTFGAGVGAIFNDVGVRVGGIADYYSSATLSPFAVFDASGRPVSGADVLTSTGYRYQTVSTSVPEPAVIALLTMGVTAMGIRPRRLRFRRSAPRRSIAS